MKVLTLDLGETIGYAWLPHETCVLGTTKRMEELYSYAVLADHVIVERVSSRNYNGNILLGQLKGWMKRRKMLDKLVEQQAYIVRTAKKAVSERFPKLRCSAHERDALCHLWRFLTRWKKKELKESMSITRSKPAKG